MENAEDLNYDCNYNMFLAKSMLENLRDVKDRQKAVKWMRKLATCNQSVPEMKLRNDFMYHLVVCIQNHKLVAPFNENPPPVALKEIVQLLPKTDGKGADAGAWASEQAAESRTPFIFANSPDGGEFLAQQPIPRCGAFCYLAVLSRKSD